LFPFAWHGGCARDQLTATAFTRPHRDQQPAGGSLSAEHRELNHGARAPWVSRRNARTDTATRVKRLRGTTVTYPLSDFLVQNRETIERQTSEVFLARSVPTPLVADLGRGIPIFMEQLIATLQHDNTDDSALAETATAYGQRLFQLGFTVSELVHGYGSVCAVVTKLAGERGYDVATRDFEVFNRTLDVAIAESVTAHERARSAQASENEAERIGALAHELRNTLAAAALSFAVIKKGTVGVGGQTAGVLDRSLTRMGVLIDRSLAEVRLRTDPAPVAERFRLADALDQIGATVGLEIESRDLRLVMEMDRELEVETDRQFLMSAVSNLVQNALNYSRTGGHVSLRGHREDDRLIIEVQDECGGLPPGKIDQMFRPFARGARREGGVGLGLSIASRAVSAIGGEIHVRDLPTQGCIFIIELPIVLAK
jgi:signal transduction histidine kinase